MSLLTTSISAKQMLQFAREVDLEVTRASYSLFEDLLSHSRGISAVVLLGVPGRLPYPSAFNWFNIGDSVAQQPQYSLPTVAVLKVAAGIEAFTSLRYTPVSEPISLELLMLIV